MKFALQPWQLMLIILASWVNRQQQQVIARKHVISQLPSRLCDHG